MSVVNRGSHAFLKSVLLLVHRIFFLKVPVVISMFCDKMDTAFVLFLLWFIPCTFLWLAFLLSVNIQKQAGPKLSAHRTEYNMKCIHCHFSAGHTPQKMRQLYNSELLDIYCSQCCKKVNLLNDLEARLRNLKANRYNIHKHSQTTPTSNNEVKILQIHNRFKYSLYPVAITAINVVKT